MVVDGNVPLPLSTETALDGEGSLGGYPKTHTMNDVSGDTSDTERPRGRHEYRHEDLPIRVDFPFSNDDDDCTDVSSVTTANFHAGELFVPHMYPSSEHVGALEDVSVSEIGLELPSQEGETAQIHPSVAGSEDPLTTIQLDDHQLKLEMERLSLGNTVTEGVDPLQKAEDKLEDQERVSWISNFPSLGISQMPIHEANKPWNPTGSGVTSIKNEPTKGERDPQTAASSIQDLVPLPMPLPTAQEQFIQPGGPGAYRVSPFGSIASRERDDPEEKEEIEMTDMQQEQHPEDPDLVQAWPVTNDLVRAEPLQDIPGDSGSGTFFSGKILRKSVFVGLAAILAAILAPSIIIPMLANDPNESEHMQIKNTIVDAFGMDYFDNPQKERALHWIVYEDPRNELSIKETVNQVDLIQRYSLVAFYFQTSSQQPWAHCNPPVDKQSDICYMNNGDLRSESTGVRWLTAAHECQWLGVSCVGGTKHVTGLLLSQNNLTGTIPADELAMLTHLRSLHLSMNNMTGPLPLSLFGNAPLQHVDLSMNKLTGSIPKQTFLVTSLDHIKLGTNHLTGSIPNEIGQFKGTHVFLGCNLFAGSIPQEIYKAKELKILDVRNNLLTGTLSSAVGGLTGLSWLDISGNQIHGSMPSQIGLLRKLTSLEIEKTNIGSTIPDELYHNKGLLLLNMNDCNIAGTISTRIGQLKDLKTFRIANNNLHGTIPIELSSASNLCALHLHGNSDLGGSIPDQFCSRLHQGCNVTADCKTNDEVPAVHCPKHCCTTCCDAETRICTEQ